jgi:hypothetical protein
MSLSPTPPALRRTSRTSRLALAVAALAAAGTFVAAVVLTGPLAPPAVDASVGTATTSQVVENPTTGERVVIDTVYVVTPAPVATPEAAAPAPPAVRGDEGEGDEGNEGGDD